MVNHYQPLWTITNHYQRWINNQSTTINHPSPSVLNHRKCNPKTSVSPACSTTGNHPFINQYQPLSTTINHYEPSMFTSHNKNITNKKKQLTITNRYKPSIFTSYNKKKDPPNHQPAGACTGAAEAPARQREVGCPQAAGRGDAHLDQHDPSRPVGVPQWAMLVAEWMVSNG